MSWVRALSGVGERLVKLWYKISFLFLLLSEVIYDHGDPYSEFVL